MGFPKGSLEGQLLFVEGQFPSMSARSVASTQSKVAMDLLATKLRLASLLPELIEIRPTNNGQYQAFWKSTRGDKRQVRRITDCEWLHIAYLIEKKLTWDQIESYRDNLSKTDKPSMDAVAPIECYIEHWSFEQRASALLNTIIEQPKPK